MKQTALALTIGLTLLFTGATALAQFGGLAPAEPIPARVVQADVIVVGKLSNEEKPVAASLFPGAQLKLEFRVMQLTVEEGLRGAKKGDVLRFGFFTPKVGTRRPNVAQDAGFTTGQECLFFLNKHHEETFSIAPECYPSLDKQHKNYATDLELTRRCVKLLEDPQAGLKAKAAEDRLLTAAMLINRYRLWRIGKNGPETELLAADESKLILNILAAADWKATIAPGSSVPLESLPANLFFQLDVSFKDGWAPAQGADLGAAARQWLKENANTYRIHRFVPIAEGKAESNEKKE